MDRLGSLDPTTARRVISDRSGNLPQNAFFFFHLENEDDNTLVSTVRCDDDTCKLGSA